MLINQGWCRSYDSKSGTETQTQGVTWMQLSGYTGTDIEFLSVGRFD